MLRLIRVVIAGTVIAIASSASAASITVDDLADTSGGTTCTLRDAINAANTNAVAGGCPAGSPGGDTITFAVNGTIVLSDMLPPIAEDLAIEGPGATELTISGNDRAAIMQNLSAADTRLAGVTLADGYGFFWGGIFNEGTLTVSRCALTNHGANGGGGWVSTAGGAITNLGTATVNQTSFVGSSTDGGAVLNVGVLSMVDCTLSGNDMAGITNAGALTLRNSTIAGNYYGVVNSGPGTLTITNCIVAGNPAGNCSSVVGGTDDLSDDATCTGFSVANPMLGPLLVHAPGTTATYALDFGSPAIDAGNDSTCTATDQRGVARPQGTHCDIGAYEGTLKCGDGVREPDEECDDGLLRNGSTSSCCNPDCTAKARNMLCSYDDDLCEGYRCDGSGSCGFETISTGCFEPTTAGASSVNLKPNGALSWRWTKGAETSLADFGDPVQMTRYTLCLYDESAGEGVNLAKVDARTYQGVFWKPTPRGFSYGEKSSSMPYALRHVKLTAGEDGRSSVIVVGKGALPDYVPDLGLPYAGRVTVQLKASNGTCWNATYSKPTQNGHGGFQARSD